MGACFGTVNYWDDLPLSVAGLALGILASESHLHDRGQNSTQRTQIPQFQRRDYSDSKVKG
jgi:hypothetical protein